ncbi:dihydrodipicolinate synthase family protein [Alkalibacillus haloalkaliphilus]|uniref:dihydrodipicolinate synthase family protein n=1 Tax=Alkalibacillus haloalkaliphilus TaxID=94136 RepID=UPI0029361D75|nr:dihydrodipicolinate synthase family protein [Alkalibacillus haloalkaliphilus]MDV2582251.1 dihydrodipicolinate synthase family protein [Alkalibacillus haloalkaliphilus]
MLKETVHIAVPTAFFNDESLNIQGTISHIMELYKQGVKSVLVSGSTGEQHSLHLREKIEILNALEQEEELISNMEIIFGVASVRQKEAEELAEKIRHTKISGIMLGYSPYVIPTQEEALVYTKRIIQLCNKPTILYNNPKRTGFDLSEESIIQLSEIDLVIGIKDAGNKEKVGRIKNATHRDELYFYAGGEESLEEKVLLQGYNRLSSIAGNSSPIEISQWFQKILIKENVSEQESEKIDNIMEQVYQGNPIVNLKKIINHKGIPMGICRSPIGNIVPD